MYNQIRDLDMTFAKTYARKQQLHGDGEILHG